MQRYSQLFGKTKKQPKRGMKYTSHKLLYQGGFVKELSSGRYEYLPLGFKVWERLVNLIDEEMKSIGSQRISIPLLQPIDIWKKTNRDSAWGSELMKIKDARGAEFALSATGEGVITDMVSEEAPTYKDLPIIVHQFIAKFRDEKRPRGGLLRVREFVMKDAYSYNTTEEDFMNTYNSFYDSYGKICDKLKLPYYPVIANSGALGGDYCHEFQVPCKAGEDTIVVCDKCNYAANIEMAKFKREEVNKNEEVKPMDWVDQKWEEARTIKQMTKFFNKPESSMIKAVAYKTTKGKIVIGIVTGNLEVNVSKLELVVGEGELKKADEKDLASVGAVSGTLHAWGYEEYGNKVITVVDQSIVKARNLCGGFKTKEKDPKNVNYGRDFKADLGGDIAEPYEGAECTECGGKIKLIKTVEFGHVFKYDHFYTKAHNATFVDRDGKNKYMYMGAYGIGIGRAIATTVEIHHDQKGIVWPVNIAPYHIHFITLDTKHSKKAEQIIKNIEDSGLEVLWDETDSSAGEKFANADLIGCPIRVLLSKKSIEAGGVEVKLRSSDKSQIVAEKGLVLFLQKQINALASKK